MIKRKKQKQIETMSVGEFVEINTYLKNNDLDTSIPFGDFYEGLADSYRIMKEDYLLNSYEEEGFKNEMIKQYPEISAATPVIVKIEKEGNKQYAHIASCNKIGCSAGRKYHSGKYGAKYLEKMVEKGYCQDFDLEDFDLENAIKIEYEYGSPISKESIELIAKTINIFTDEGEYPKIENVADVFIRSTNDKWTVGFPTIQKNEECQYKIKIGYNENHLGEIGFQWRGDVSFECTLLKKFGGICDAGNGVGIMALDRLPAYVKRKLGIVSESEVYKKNKALDKKCEILNEKVRDLERTNQELSEIKRKPSLIERMFTR
jgi:hypothetical protein